jgi:hypothetical protein
MSQCHSKRDPSMYGDDHKCNKCEEQAKYIKRNLHWCLMCWNRDEYPHMIHLSDEQIDALRTENIKSSKGRGIFNVENMKSKVGF